MQCRTDFAIKPSTCPAAILAPLIGATIPGEDLFFSTRETRNVEGWVSLDKADMAELIMAIAEQRDRSAYGQVFDHFAPRVKSYLLGLRISPEQADDVLQEVMIAVWNKAGSYRPDKAAVSTWIFTIARNKHIDRIRREKHQFYDSLEVEAVETEIAEHDVADEQVSVMQRKRAVQAALSKLPEDQMTVISMSFLKDMAHAEIATALDLPLGTVKSRIRLGFQRMRQELGDML
jgi:RNA polymerase sigma-70 factor (ECF subfamily)